MKLKILNLLLLLTAARAHALTCPEIQQELITTQTLSGALLAKTCMLNDITQNNAPATCSKIDIVQSVLDQTMSTIDLPCPAIPIRASDAPSGGTLSLVGTGTTFVLQQNIDFALHIEDSNITVDLCGKEINITGRAIRVVNESNIIIKNGKLTGYIEVSDSSGITLDHLDAHGSTGGIELISTEKVRIAHCSVCDTQITPLILSGVQDALIADTILSNGSGANCLIQTATAISFERCMFDSASSDGILMGDAYAITITDCQFTENNGSQIFCTDVHNLLIDRCLLSTSTTNPFIRSAIQLNNTDAALISNCYLSSNDAANGIKSDSTSATIKIADCCLVGTNTTHNGIDLDGLDSLITQCTISGFTQGVVANQNSTRTCVLDCVAYNCSIGFQATALSTDALFQNNKAIGNLFAGFDNSSPSAEFMQNVANNNGTSIGVNSNGDYANSGASTYFDLASTVTGSSAFGGTGPISAWVNIFKG